jgi:putative copper resistance protein D
MEQTLINPLIAVRDIHFGSTVIVAGIVFFDFIIASPTLRATGSRLETTAVAFRARTALALWISLALSIVSGFAWLVLLAARIVGNRLKMSSRTARSGLFFRKPNLGSVGSCDLCLALFWPRAF